MEEYENNLLLGTTPEINDIYFHTKAYLHNISTITKTPPYHATPIPQEDHTN